MPFPLRCLDTDNGSEFINEALIHYCATNGIELTRSRPYRKNDQAYVEQKNGAIVRRLVGYGRLGGIAAAEALATLYTASRLFVNFFQPSFKLREKQRVGARVIKRYHKPESPCSRLLTAPSVTAATKARLLSVQEQLDPLRLLEAIRTAQQRIASMIAGQQTARPRAAEPNLDHFLASLGCAWQTGEVRPTHAQEPRPERHWRTRPDPLDGVWDLVEGWLEAEPDRTAVELLARLHELDPTRVRPEVLRTLQRRVRTWRQVAARRLVFGGNILPAT